MHRHSHSPSALVLRPQGSVRPWPNTSAPHPGKNTGARRDPGPGVNEGIEWCEGSEGSEACEGSEDSEGSGEMGG